MVNGDFIKTFMEGICSFPHRGSTTAHEKEAADLIERTLKDAGADVEQQSFSTSTAYIYEIWWMLVPMMAALYFLPAYPVISFAVIAVMGLSLLLYFDWRHVWVMHLPPRGRSQNIIARKNSSKADKNLLVLMAHYDSAPVSFLYLPSQVGNFAVSLRFNMINILLVMIIAGFYAAGIENSFLYWIRIVYIVYFFVQIILSSVDFFRLGYTNGAADNGSGVVAASAAALALWEEEHPGWKLELVITGAEEVGMRGAEHYFRVNRRRWAEDGINVHVLNFDNVGAGDLKIITRTGSISPVVYDNVLTEKAHELTSSSEKYRHITASEWHTGDFDSIHFARKGIPGLTLSAQDENGLVPNLHRLTDTLENVDMKVVEEAGEFAADLCRELMVH